MTLKKYRKAFLWKNSPPKIKHETLCNDYKAAGLKKCLDSVSSNSFFENNKIFINHILLIVKLYVYKSREKKFINVNNLIAEIQKVKKIGKEIASNNSKKTISLT